MAVLLPFTVGGYYLCFFLNDINLCVLCPNPILILHCVIQQYVDISPRLVKLLPVNNTHTVVVNILTHFYMYDYTQSMLSVLSVLAKSSLIERLYLRVRAHGVRAHTVKS